MTRREATRLREMVVKATIQAIAILLAATLFAGVLLEWVAGCGEITYYPDGTWQTNECLFIDNEIKTGTW